MSYVSPENPHLCLLWMALRGVTLGVDIRGPIKPPSQSHPWGCRCLEVNLVPRHLTEHHLRRTGDTEKSTGNQSLRRLRPAPRGRQQVRFIPSHESGAQAMRKPAEILKTKINLVPTAVRCSPGNHRGSPLGKHSKN